jgi:hypothetical protein
MEKPLKEIDALLLENLQLKRQFAEFQVHAIVRETERVVQEMQRRYKTQGYKVDLVHRRWIKEEEN